MYVLRLIFIALHKKIQIRCDWVPKDPLYREYHDNEWGTPQHDDVSLFELLILEGMQAGLSWSTVLRKRENFRRAFDYFDPVKISKYKEAKLLALKNDEGIIRNSLKIRAAVLNANAFLKIQNEYGSFDAYIWKFVGGTPKKNSRKDVKEIPARTLESDAMSKDLSSRGFKFVGSTICYSFMQASGMVNDHITKCFRYGEL